MNRRRLDGDAMRDTILAVAGTLNLKMGGSADPAADRGRDGRHARPVAVARVNPDPAEHNRRSIYLQMKRSLPLPMLEIFDAPDTAASCPRRETSTVAPQALALMNSEFMLAQARAVRRPAPKQAGDNPEASVEPAGGWPSGVRRRPARSRRRSIFSAQHPCRGCVC